MAMLRTFSIQIVKPIGAKSSAASLDSLYTVLLFHPGGCIVQRQIAFSASFTGFNSMSQGGCLIFLALKQPQGRTDNLTA